MMTYQEREAWLAIRKEAGLKIDPETARGCVDLFRGCSILTAYTPNFQRNSKQVEREYFARILGSRRRGRLWRFARGDPRRTFEEAAVKVGISAGT